MSWSDVVAVIVMLGGCFFFFVASVGTINLPDIYCRAHALGKATTLGIMLTLIGYGFRVPEASWVKIGVIVAFQIVTVPVASHLLFLIAFRQGVGRPPSNRSKAGRDSY